MSGKTISELPFLGNPSKDGMLPLEVSGTTYHIMFSSVTDNNTNNILYNGEDYDCLGIKNNTSLTTVIESIGDVLCKQSPPVNPCLSLLLEEDYSGSCKSPMKYVFDLATISWCNDNQPYVCEGISPFVYIFGLVNEIWENENQPYVCNGTDPIEYLFTLTNETWENENQPYVCDGINPIDYLFENGYEIWLNDNKPFVCEGENSLKYFIDLVKNSWSNIQQ